MVEKVNRELIEKSLIELDDFLQICNPVQLGIFKIIIGNDVDFIYRNKMIDIVYNVLNSENKENEDMINIEVPKTSICDSSCPYFGYQCNINKMFKDCGKIRL